MKEFIFHSKTDDSGVRVTVAGLIDESYKSIKWGVARCSSKDSFERKRGIQIAVGRANKFGKEFPLDDFKKENIGSWFINRAKLIADVTSEEPNFVHVINYAIEDNII